MNTNNSNLKLKTLIKSCILVAIAAFSINVCDARVHVGIGFGVGPAYYPEPYPDVVWVPGHWEDGYYVQGQYVQYDEDYGDYYGPGPGIAFFGFGGGGGHWHHGGGGGGGFHMGGGHRR